MSKKVDFATGTIVTDVFLDSVQEALTGVMSNLRVSPSGLGSDRIRLDVAGDQIYDARGSVNIGGQYCYLDTAKDSTPASGAGGTKTIFLSTTANGTPQEPDFNITVSDYSSPPAASYIRNIGTAELTAGVLNNVRLKNGIQIDADQYNSVVFRSVKESTVLEPTEVVLSSYGHATQTSISTDANPSSSPTKALSVGLDVSGTDTERLYIDTQGKVVWADKLGGSEDIAISWYKDDDTPEATSPTLAVNYPITSYVASSVADNLAYAARRESDTANRFKIDRDGTLSWGDGTTAPTASISFVSANTISLASGDKIQQNAAPTVGDDLTNKTYVDTQDGTIVSASKRFAFFMGR